MAEAVVLVAAEAVTALSEGARDGLAATYDALLERRVERSSVPGVAGGRAARVTDAGDAEAEGGARVLGPHGRLLARCAGTARERARADEVAPERLGLYVALGMVDSPVEDLAPALASSRDEDGAFDLRRFFARGFREIHPLWPLAMLNNVPVGQVSVDLRVQGDHAVLSPEADAGAQALGQALEALRTGAADAALVAGVSERAGPLSLARRVLRGAVGDAGEGAGALFLERETSARARGAPVRARVTGAGAAFGDDGAERALRAACDDASTRVEDLGVVFAAAPLDVPCPRASTLAALGDLLAAGPVVEAALAVLCFQAGEVPPALSTTGARIPLRAPRRVGVVGRGHAGGAAAFVLEGA